MDIKNVTPIMIEEFKRKAERPNCLDMDVKRLISACGSVEEAVKIIKSRGGSK